MLDQDKLAAAVKEHRKAVALAPDNGWFQHNLGMAYERQRNYEEAVAQYRKTLTVDPNLAYTRYRLGMIYSRTRNTRRLSASTGRQSSASRTTRSSTMPWELCMPRPEGPQRR